MSIANLHTAYLTIAEVAAAMRLSRITVYRMVRAGTLAADRFGKSYRVPESAVEEYMRQAGSPATGQEAHPGPDSDSDPGPGQG
ncbi:helix-turn-helix domain-containing protein [Arthrobacter sp. ISL-5]|uniref:helix-turn-helix domain-containing protein n=1 Tax=Arthrobacter sp. ISL-5 TaxID=2819111 RepID=UPI001BE5F0CD|nr:helix-turn-helix domain-containing protein [Arthrobacter sp. ISL-5]MBT2553152.1 helix-turn-helix domain-containing protein [Arthrobacter sp. ISL-5]